MNVATGQLTFDLLDLDGQKLFQDAVNAPKMRAVLEEIDQWLRTKLKHGHSFRTADKALEEARQHLHDLLEENNLTLE